MKIIGIGLEPDVRQFLTNHGFLLVNLSDDTEEVKTWVMTNQSEIRGRCIVIIDYDKAPNLKQLHLQQKFKIIGLSSDWRLRKADTTAARYIFKGASPACILNLILEVAEERECRQLAELPLYVYLNEPELDTPFGTLPLTDVEQRILLYLANNLKRYISTEEMVFHVFPEGYAYDINTQPEKMFFIFMSILKRKLRTVIQDDVILRHKQDGYFLRCASNQTLIEMSFTRQKVHKILANDEIRELSQKYFETLSKYIAQKSLQELRTNKKLKAKSLRVASLKNNLTIRPFTLEKLHSMIKKLRFKAPPKILHVWNNIQALPNCDESENNDICIY